MIVVAGEALIDVLAGDERPRGGGRSLGDARSLSAHPGGAPFNVARFIARLGADATFLGTLSDDGFGDDLRAALWDAGVAIATPGPVSAPTTLALATLDAGGAADYRIYLDGTSAAALAAPMIPAGLLGSSGDMLVLGGLGLVGEPAGTTLSEFAGSVGDDAIVVLDPNCRPRAIRDPAAYRARIDGLLGRVDVLKVSVEDLAYLRPGIATADAARELAAAGPSAVFVTDGGAPMTMLAPLGGSAASGQAGARGGAGPSGPGTALGSARLGDATIPVPATAVVDTIGAGDAFVAGFVAWWSARGMPRAACRAPSLLHQAARAALEVSAAVCGCAGAELPADFTWSAGNV